MVTSKRIPIKHLCTLKPIDFIKILKYIKLYDRGVISTRNHEITQKMDGFNFKFGIGENKKLFIETAHSGLVWKPLLSKTFYDKFGRVSPIMHAFDDVFIELLKNEKLIEYLTLFPRSIKIFTELFYKPLAKEEDSKLRLVNIPYGSEVFKKKINFALITMCDKDGNEEQYFKDMFFYNLMDLFNNSLENIYFFQTKINEESFKDIDISTEIEYILKYINRIENFEKILSSRKHCDINAKNEIKNDILFFQNELTKLLLLNYTNESEYEGIVFKTRNYSFKVVSNNFLTKKEKYKDDFK